MMPAAKHFDPVLGIDIHIIQPPGPVPPIPIPHPHIGIVIDPADYVPIIGATVKVGGIPRAIAGTAGKALPPHFPIGGVFVKPPSNENEVFMGSSTVSFDGDAASYMALPCLSCQDIGIPTPFRPKKKGKVKSLVLPTSVVLAIPAGRPVLIGGSPTISLMALGMRIGMAALGKAFKRLAKTKFARRLMKKFKKFKGRIFRKMKPGFIKCKVLRAEPVDVVTGEVAVEQQDFTIPGLIPLEWNRVYGSHSERIGLCGYGWETPADARLEFEHDGSVTFYDGSPGATGFDSLPLDGPVKEPVEGAALDQLGNHLIVRKKDGLTFFFPKPRTAVKEILVERIQDLCGNYWQFIYKDKQLVEIKESAGRSLKINTRNGRVEQIHLAHPEEPQPRLLAIYDYSKEGDLAVVYDALKVPYRFHYKNHCLVQHTDRNGLSFYYEYDEYSPEGRCLHTWGDGGLYNYHFKFLDLLGRTEITNSLGHTSTIQYNSNNVIEQEIDPLGGVTKYEYDEAGRASAVVDPGGNRTEYKYDEAGNLIKLTRPDGKSIVTEFNAASQAIKIIDPNGAVWQQEWDDRGLLRLQVSPLGAESRYEYDHRGQLIGFSNPLGTRTTLGFDGFGNLTSLHDALGHATTFGYDALGNVVSKTDPLGQNNGYAYDAKGRLTQAVLPSGATIACAYDQEDNLVRYVDENGAQTRLEYFGLGEIKRRIQPDGHSVEYHYDTEEQLIGVTNQRGERYELQRDALGRIIAETDYWGQTRHYGYTPAGYLTESRDPLDRLIRYKTDPLGRILKKILPDPAKPEAVQNESFEYDANGNLVACENNAISIKREFDAESRLVQEQQGETCVVANEYDLNGNRITRTTELQASGETQSQTVRYRYDALEQAIAVEVAGHAPIELTRNALGQVTRETLSSRLTRRFAYSPDGYLTSQEVTNAEMPLLQQTYAYDRAGNLIEKRDSIFGIEQFTYDPLGRLISHLDPQSKLQKYLNDPAGDRLRTRVLQREAANEQEAEWRREGEYEGIHYRFDRAGNLVDRADPESRTHFEWDANQRLIQSTTDGRATKYAYDPLGRRISKITGNVTTQFYWDGDALLGDVQIDAAKEQASPQRLREWVYYPETFEPLALIQIQLDQSNSGVASFTPSLYLYHNDPNGCPTRLLDPSGEVVWAAQYSAWGKVERLHVNRVDNPIRLQGQYEDEETGLCYNRHRYYDSRAGQFVSQDPLLTDAGENIYRYAPNIWRWSDPLGLKCGPREARRLVRRGQGPRGIHRIDAPKVKGEQWHAHFGPGEGSPALNLDGTWKHAGPAPTREVLDFLRKHGWQV